MVGSGNIVVVSIRGVFGSSNRVAIVVSVRGMVDSSNRVVVSVGGTIGSSNKVVSGRGMIGSNHRSRYGWWWQYSC